MTTQRIATALQAKDVDEIDVLTFDFAPGLNVGEAVASATVSCEAYDGADPTPGNVLSGIPQVAGNTVRQKITLGEAGVTYLIRAVAELSGSTRRLTIAALLPVVRL